MANVAIMGMGFVGLTLSVALAKKGVTVYGIEKDPAVLEQLSGGKPHFTEKGLAPLLKHYVASGNISLHSQLTKEMEIDAYIVSVGTPLYKETKKPNTDYIKQVLQEVGQHVRAGGLIVMRSTVAVGACRSIAIPEVEQYSGLKVGRDVSFVFAPERTVEGNAIQELEKNPQVIGGVDYHSVTKASKLFSLLTPTILKVSSLEAAEMVKLMDNSYRDLRFSYSNQIAQICEKIGLDAEELIECANMHYPRNSIPVPSPGVGGACLSKDPYILADAAEKAGAEFSLLVEGRRVNEEILQAILERIEQRLEQIGKDIKQARIGIAGFAFKGVPETSDLRESTTVWFLDVLKDKHPELRVVGYDPVVSSVELEQLGVETAESVESLAEGCDVLMLMNNHPSYLEIDPYSLTLKMNKPGIFYDAWRMQEKSVFDALPEVEYMGVGV